MNRTDKSRPAEIVLIANEKGGVGKTSTALGLACSLIALGYSVMICDMDPSANLSTTILNEMPKLSLYDAFTGDCRLPDCLVQTPFGDVAPSVKNLPDLDGTMSTGDVKSLTQIANQLLGVRGGEYFLSRMLRKTPGFDLNEHYDFVIIDSAPSDNILITNAIVAANSVIVPVELSMAAIDGLQMFLGSISTAHEFYKTTVSFDGMLTVKYSEEGSSDRKVAALLNDLCATYQIPRYDTKIRFSKTMRAALDNGKPILEYIHNGHGGADTLNMTLEFLRKRGLKPRNAYPGVVQDENGNWVYLKPSKKEA